MDPVAAPPSMSPVSLPPYAQQPAVASTSAASISAPAAAAAAESKRTVTRLPKEALEILRDFYKRFGAYPTSEQRSDLIDKIHSISGGEHYTRDQLSRYFANKRREKRLAGQQAAKSASQNYLWPSLTEQKIERLRDLWQEKRNPSRKVIAVWAQSLGVEESHINAWLTYQCDDDDDDDNTPATDGQREQTHLPTPEPTASPEPTFVKIGHSPPSTPIQPGFFPTANSSFQAAPPGRHYAPTSHAYPPPAVVQYPPKPLSFIPCQPPQYLKSQPPTPVSPVAPFTSWPTANAAQKSSSLKPDNMSPVAAASVPQAPRPASPPAPVQKPTPPAPSREELMRRRMQSAARDVMSRADTDDKDVHSLPEYDVQYASVLERECTEFLSRAERGRYASLGLKAKMVPPREAFEEGLRHTAA